MTSQEAAFREENLPFENRVSLPVLVNRTGGVPVSETPRGLLRDEGPVDFPARRSARHLGPRLALPSPHRLPRHLRRGPLSPVTWLPTWEPTLPHLGLSTAPGPPPLAAWRGDPAHLLKAGLWLLF